MTVMVEGTRALLAILAMLAAMSVVAVAGYVAAFLVAAVWTTARRDRRDPLAAELDRMLDDVVRSESTVGALPGRQDVPRARAR